MISKLEARRQVFHILFGFALALLIYFELVDFLILVLIATAGILLSMICRRYDVPAICWFLSNFDREEDKARMPGKGAVYYLVGTLITYGLFIMLPEGKNIIAASLIILALGDAMPHFVAHMAKIKHPFSDVKYVESGLFGAAIAFMGAVWFVGNLEALLASLAAMFIEGIDLKIGIDVDDNMIIPVVAATVIWLISMI
jgi:dolichol kinase